MAKKPKRTDGWTIEQVKAGKQKGTHRAAEYHKGELVVSLEGRTSKAGARRTVEKMLERGSVVNRKGFRVGLMNNDLVLVSVHGCSGTMSKRIFLAMFPDVEFIEGKMIHIHAARARWAKGGK